MTKRNPNTRSKDTGRLSSPEAVPPGTRATEPIEPKEPTPPPPPGGYASIGSRRGGPSIPRSWIGLAVLVVVLVFVLGYLVGRSRSPEPAPTGEQAQQAEQGQQEAKKGKLARRARACRRAVNLSAQLIQLQTQALTSYADLTEALVAEDAEKIELLTSAGEQLQAQITEVQGKLDPAFQRCRA